MTVGLPLMKSVLTPLAKSVLILLELSIGISAINAAIQNQIYGSGRRLLALPLHPFWLSFGYNNINNFKWRNERCNENS